MSKMSQLSQQPDELVRCGEALIGVAESLRELFSGEEASAEAEPVNAGSAVEKKAKVKKEPVQEEKKAYTLEDVRTILAEKSREGFTEEVKAVIAKRGAKKLSGIDPAEYEAIVAEVEGLGNA